MKKLRKFKLEETYHNSRDNGELPYPSVSYTKDSDNVWVKPYENYIIAKYNVTDTSEEIYTYSWYSQLYGYELLTKVIVDGEEAQFDEWGNFPSFQSFDTIGEHTIEFYLSDKITSLSYLFEYCYNLISVDFTHLDTSELSGTCNQTFLNCESLKEVKFGKYFNTSNIYSMTSMFCGCKSLEHIDLSSFDTNNVEKMDYMFDGCESLKSLDLSNFDTTLLLSTCSMFYGCKSLTSLDLSSWDTSKLINANQMFKECSNLSYITILGNVSRIGDYENMFDGLPSNGVITYNCAYSDKWDEMIEETNVSNWEKNCQSSNFNVKLKILSDTEITNGNVVINNVNCVYNLETQCWECSYLADRQSYDIILNNTVIGTTNHKQIQHLFLNENVSYIDETIVSYSNTYEHKLLDETYVPYISEMYVNGIKQDTAVSTYIFDTFGLNDVIYVLDSSQTLTTCENMFSGCETLISLDLSHFNTSNVLNMNNMFKCRWGYYYCLYSLNLSNFDTSNVTNMFQMFYYCENLTSLDLSSFDTSKVTSMTSMFWNCISLTSLDVSSFDTSEVTDMTSMFWNCISLTSLDLNSFNTPNVTNMGSMFLRCYKLTSIEGLDEFDTSNVTNMSYMFEDCNKLTSLDLSSFNTSKVTSMTSMFDGCTSLISLDLSSFNTSKVTSMSHMFDNCNSLTSMAQVIGFNNFNTSNVTNMSYMFYRCTNLTSLDLSNFDTSAVTNMYSMFEYCSGLTSLDLSNFDTSKVTSMGYMFNGCSGLISIEFGSKSDVSKVTKYYSNMFTNVPSECTLTLCNNTQTSWSTLLSKVSPKPSNIVYKECN